MLIHQLQKEQRRRRRRQTSTKEKRRRKKTKGTYAVGALQVAMNERGIESVEIVHSSGNVEGHGDLVFPFESFLRQNQRRKVALEQFFGKSTTIFFALLI
jgi:hypothetical protein